MSRARERLSRAAFEDMVARSSKNNWRDGITGLLLFDGWRFLQAIEGREQLVNACYERIKADGRHGSVVEVERNNLAEREFGDWSLRALDSTDEAPAFRDSVNSAVAGVTDDRLRATFIGFAKLAR